MSHLEDRRPIQVPEGLAEVLGFSVSAVEKLVSQGKIETVKQGKHRYAMPEKVHEYLDSLVEESLPGIFRGKEVL